MDKMQFRGGKPSSTYNSRLCKVHHHRKVKQESEATMHGEEQREMDAWTQLVSSALLQFRAQNWEKAPPTFRVNFPV